MTDANETLTDVALLEEEDSKDAYTSEQLAGIFPDDILDKILGQSKKNKNGKYIVSVTKESIPSPLAKLLTDKCKDFLNSGKKILMGCLLL